MLCTNDIVLVDESRDNVNVKLETWLETLKPEGFKISRTKTEYMDFNFSGHIKRGENTMRIEDYEIPLFPLTWLNNQ